MSGGQALPVRFPCWCKAVYSWGGEVQGDLIECLNAGDGSWWMGRLKRDRRMVGLFPSNFVELLSEDFQPWNRNGSGSISRQNSAQEPAKQTPQKAKSTFRKPFTAYAAASSPNPAAAARERLKAGGVASPNGSVKTKSPNSPDEPETPSNPWSPDAFDQVYQASAKKVRAQSALGLANGDEEDEDGPPNMNNYVQRMESRLRRMQQQEKSRNEELFVSKDSSEAPPPVPLKNSSHHMPGSSIGTIEHDVARKGSKLLRHRKSAYDVGRDVLGRTFTSKTNSTTTTHTSNSTNRSLMSGHSATNMSSTSAGSYYRKRFGKDRPKSVMETGDATGKGYGFDDGRPETPFTGVTYHSSHASRPRPGSSNQQQQEEVTTPATTDGPDPLGGLRQPKAKRSGFFRKMIDTAKTQAANARSTIAAGSISRPGSRAASRAASRAQSRAASRLDNNGPTSIEGGTTVQSANASRDMGLGSNDWVQVRRDVNRSNSLSKNERTERADRCQMMDLPMLNPVDTLYESAEGDEGLDGLPIAEPTDFAACSLTHVDKSARFINAIPLGTTPATLAQGYVCRPYRSDVQRLRAIFTWVSERISWEEDFEGKMDPRHVLQSKRGCSEEIAMVVAEMCASVGLHAEVVRGYLKTPGEPLDLDSVARPNHFWNAVIVEGEWRMMDCSLAGPTNPKRVHYSNAGSSVAESWYFLARPMEICYSHVPLLPEQQHICPPQPHDVLMALPCATPTYFRHGLHMADFDTSLLNLDNLEMAHVYVDVPDDVECVAEVEARSYSQDMDGDFFESGDFVRKPALAQAEWRGGQKRYTVKALLPGDEGQGVLKIYAGPRGLMHSNKLNPHTLAIGLPMSHSGSNPPYSFLTLHPTPHAQRHDLYVAQPQCANLALNNTFVFCVRQHPSSLNKSPEPNAAINGRASPNPFARPASAMSMQSISASGSNYTNPSQSSSGSSSSNSTKPAKLAIQTPSGKIIRLTRKSEHMSSTNDADGTAWETIIKIGEKGTWRGLVLADRKIRSSNMDAQIAEWTSRAEAFKPLNLKAIEPALLELDAHLTLRSHIVGYTLSDADTIVWKTLRENRVAHAFIKQSLMPSLCRWFRYIEEAYPQSVVVVGKGKEEGAAGKSGKDGKAKSDDANYDIGLQDVGDGTGIVTRFPPEPSGYLHIGHAKAALLNDYFAHEKYKGKLLLRFDDTNPTKEKQEFQDAIVEDCALMGIKPDQVSYTSDWFDQLYERCVQMLKDGLAYADDTLQEKMRAERMDGIASARRDASVEDNLAQFEEMKKGNEEGVKWCIRAKMSVDNPNKAMRDPVIYRCNPQAHHRTGDKWKIYPTYDFCCPIVDALEGVTHALRTTEYNDRDPQYQWFIKNLNLRQVYNWGFARLNFVRTVLSKRKLTKIVDAGIVWGWDDPRMPTVRGVRRRGAVIPALREFILKQGPSKNIVNLDWYSFWATNKKHIEPTAARYTAIDEDTKVPVTIIGAREGVITEDKPKHAKYDLGNKKIVFSSSVLLEQADAQSFAQDEEITLMNWGNAIVRKISHSINPLAKHGLKTVTGLELELHLQGDVKKTSKKVTWLSTDQNLIPIELVDFDYLITKDKLEPEDTLEDFLSKETEFRTKAVADCNAAELKVDDIVQFDRKGFFRIDRAFAHNEPIVAFQVPTGKSK
ncbi:glutamyl-tRNA synthetase [Cucurbitaria berberidis CBS 394.84]|uniref:glutamate--tRNA ligase n=1 Tax=Cucurbitaria berberidis CBS 394.84 TaxID=1168544 RepID=A0A9P4GMF4_9PLEO|nr:glutamyl-tRNA synthetase [Cucurbitaria berberidis CBS 394.84]KAF1847884.1 glutamyl-tRNA synthetase [Cucurbitaria berberidis CBS 394.84]